MRVNENILISSLTTMQIGGPARYVIEIENPRDVRDAYGFVRTLGLPVFVLGYGANTIGRDEGFAGVIIMNRMQGIYEEPIENGLRLTIMGGEYWDNVVEYATSRGLTGIEALSKIPGLAGAAPVQNIGAYGQEIADTLTSIEVYDTADGEFKTLTHDELGFSYRHSILNTTEYGRYFVMSITLELHYGQMQRPFYGSIETYIDERNLIDCSPASMRAIVSDIRSIKLPDLAVHASAGSFFKNVYLTEADAEIAEDKGYPIHRGKDGIKINAAWLIEQCKLKGKLIDGFRISEKAPLVLINESATSYAELDQARFKIVNKVYDKFGYWLEQEPVEILNSQPVQAIQPVQPAQDAQLAQPAQSAQDAQQTQPAQSAQDEQLAQPVQPIEPAGPVQPIEPAQPMQPIEPAGPVQGMQPIEPAQPMPGPDEQGY